MIQIAVVMAASVAVGVWAAGRRPEGAQKAATRTMDFVLWVLIPFVMFFNLVRFELSAEIGAALGLSMLANLAAVGLAWLIATRVMHLDRPSVGAMMTCALLGNTAYMGYPFVVTALGFDELPVAVSYDMLVMVPTLLLIGFSIGAAYGTVAERPRDRVRTFFTRNPLLYAAIAALLAPDSLAPQWAVDATRILVVAILPLGFFAVGVTLRHEAEVDELSFPPPLTSPVAATVAIKLIVPPALLLLASELILHIPRAYIVEAAMPCGVNNLLIANAYGLDRKLAASAIVWSTPVVLAAGIIAQYA
jgi:predicted permease